VQRIRIRLNALSTDSNAVNAPSYPSQAIEANPANSIEMTSFTGYQGCRHALSIVCSGFSPQLWTERKMSVFRLFYRLLDRGKSPTRRGSLKSFAEAPAKLSAHVFRHMGFQPVPVLEKGAKR
jgi:hypothetical protein